MSGESRIVHIDSKNNTVILAYSRQHALNQKLLEQGGYFVAEHFSAQVQFFIPKLAQVMFQQGYAFTISIPEELYRIQRRENFRARVPDTNGVRCTIPLNGAGPLQVPISDISRGGIALLDRQGRLPLELGKLLNNCLLDLPTVGPLKADMEVRNPVARVGCRFTHMSAGMENMLQRYIDQLEIRRRSSI
jgi:c-di-GMP-binding flagellar brake protein YcgR